MKHSPSDRNIIRFYRTLHFMTQTELAEKVGVTQGAISMIENGDRSPSLDVLIRLASALNCTLDDLVKVKREDEMV